MSSKRGNVLEWTDPQMISNLEFSFYYTFTLLRVFHTSFSRWFLIGVWVTASLPKSPGPFSVFNNAVIWVVSTCPLISKSSSPCTSIFGDCTKSTNYNWYHRHFHVPQILGGFSSLARSKYLSMFLLSFSFTLRSTIRQVLFFFPIFVLFCFVDYH